MFGTVDGLSPLLIEYFVALNHRDVPRALACVHPDLMVEIENAPDSISAMQGRAAFGQMLSELMNVRLLAVSPVSAELVDNVTRVEASVFVIRSSGVAVRLMQRVDIGLTDDLIATMTVKLPRGLREISPASN